MKSKPATDYRQRLIDALATIIVREGYGNAKIQEIASEARVSLRTFYMEFETKEACFLSLYEQQDRVLHEILLVDLDFAQPWPEVMREGFRRYFVAMTAFPKLTHAIHIELATLSDEAREMRQRKIDGFVDLMCDLVERGRRANPEISSRPLTPLMARALMGAVIEMVFDRAVRGELHRIDDLIDTSTDLLWSVVTTADQSSRPARIGPIPS